MLLQRLIHLVYPPLCLTCGARVMDDFALCGRCMGRIPFAAGLVCDRCAAPLPGLSDRAELCDACLTEPPPWDRARAVLLYQPATRDLILPLKNGDRTDLARPLGTWLARAASDILTPHALIAPVPLHWTRMAARKYNQAALIARSMARKSGTDYCPDLLRRVRRTRKLGKFGAQKRAAMLDGAIALHRPEKVRGRDIILVDDVLTTGATLGACTRLCQEAGAASVSIAILARTSDNAAG